MIYLIGSLRNPEVPKIAQALRQGTSEEIFDDWYAAGPEADDYWRDYERARGRSLAEALQGLAARAVYTFDKRNLERADTVVLVLPAGKSGHLELGWALGQGKRGYILLDNDPERYDVMYQFADGVFSTLEELINALQLQQSTVTITSTDQLSQVGSTNTRMHPSIPRLGISCGCSDCIGDNRDLGGNWGTLSTYYGTSCHICIGNCMGHEENIWHDQR